MTPFQGGCAIFGRRSEHLLTMAESRDTRRRFEQWANNPQCEANTLSAVHNVSMVAVALREGLSPTRGQSPFAIARGRSFERQLYEAGGRRLREELARQGVLDSDDAEFFDFRIRLNSGKLADLDQARERTADLLRATAASARKGQRLAPVLVAGATVSVPGGVMLPEAILVLDALVVRRDAPGADGKVRLIVGEIKTYPDRGGYTDRRELALARAQAGVYVHGLRLVLADLGCADAVEAPGTGFLVLSRPGFNFPSVRANEDLEEQAARAARGFERLRLAAAQTIPPPPADPVPAISAAGFSYSEVCVSFCDRTEGCHKRALASGDPAVLGDEMVRFLGGVDLSRATALMEGGKPKTLAEADLLRRIEELDTSLED